MNIKTGLLWLLLWSAGAFDMIGVYHMLQVCGVVPITLSEEAAEDIWAQYQRDHIVPNQKAAIAKARK